MSDIKLYAIVSNEAVAASKGNRGKMGAQIGHAYVHAFVDSLTRFPDQAKAYLDSGVVAKVCLKADEAILHHLSRLYQDKCGVFLVKDAGLTVFPRPMITALGIGPININDRETILKGLNPWI
jgi:peptidyl-tRNA hydrolase